MISVIIPIYNVEKYLDQCIQSIISQTYSELEIILVNDGSTDHSLQICREYEKKDARIKLIDKENNGLVSARKAGLQIASGEYASYVDGDDWVEPDFYEQMLDNMIENKTDLVESAHFVDAGTTRKIKPCKLNVGCYESQQIIPSMLCDLDFEECRLSPYVWSKLFYREILCLVQNQVDDRIILGEDVAVTYPYVLKCKRISVTDYAGYHYVQRNDSVSHTRQKGEDKGCKRLIENLQQCFGDSRYADCMRKQLNQYAKLMLLIQSMDLFDCGHDTILNPFGGGSKEERYMIYGAGNLGQSVYNYLRKKGRHKVVAWVDKDAQSYCELGLDVRLPEKQLFFKKKYDRIIVAVFNQKTVRGIKDFLLDMGLRESVILCLTDDFRSLEYDVLDKLEEGEI